jgi:agmatinase
MAKRTVLPDSRVSPRFAGISTFCRYPRLTDVEAESRPVDWAVYGAPFDTGVTYRPGARFGPRAVREASQYIKRFHMFHNLDVCDLLSIADAGDAPVWPFDIGRTLDQIADFALSLQDVDGDGPPAVERHTTKLLAVGGDHSIAYANLRATHERLGAPKGGLGVVHFDSHLDTVDEVWGERFSHASPFRRAIEEGLIDATRMISIGVKGPLNRADDLAFAKEHGVTIAGYDHVRANGTRDIDAFARKLGKHPVYVTFDVDVVDPAFAPGTGTPSVGGFTSAEAIDLLRRFAGINVVGGDVVEVLPDRDVSGVTALLAAQVVFEILALDACNRR